MKIFILFFFLLSSFNVFSVPEDEIIRIAKNILKKYKTNKEKIIIVSVSEQKLYLIGSEKTIKVFPVSTSIYGVGNISGSNKTPEGAHRIFKKIGETAPYGAVFEGRKLTGKIAKIKTKKDSINENIITTRILWLEGIEKGINKGKNIDSLKRYIYIHGTTEEGRIGEPSSTGCIRMKNKDIIELFNSVEEGTPVYIKK